MWVLAALLFFAQADPTSDGLKALEEGRYEAAVSAFTKAIEADPKDYFAHFNLAMSYTLLHKDAEAVAEYRKTLEIKPGLYEAELNGGIVLMRQKNPAEALALLEDAARQKPAEFRPRYYFAEALLETGDYAEAAESFQQAIALDAKSAARATGDGAGAGAAGQTGRRRAVFPRGGEDGSEISRLPAGTGAALREGQSAGGSDRDLSRVPGQPAVQTPLGEMLLESKKFAEAIPRLEEAIRRHPDNTNRIALALAYVFTQQLDKALPLLEQSVRRRARGISMCG